MKTKLKKKKVDSSKWTRGEKVLQYLFTKVDGKPANYLDVARALRIATTAASMKLMRLSRRGLVQPTSKSGIRPFYYMLTEAGLARVKATL